MDPCGPSHENESCTCIPEHCRSNQAVLNAARAGCVWRCPAGGAAEKGWQLYQEAARSPAKETFLQRQWLPKLFQRHE